MEGLNFYLENGLKPSRPTHCRKNADLFDMLKIEAFGTVAAYHKYERNHFNLKRHEREKAARRNDEGKTFDQVKREILWELVEQFPGGKAAYIEERTKFAKRSYYERSIANGKNQARIEAAKIRRNTDEAYRLRVKAKQDAANKARWAEIREYKRQHKLKNLSQYRKNQFEAYYKRNYGNLAELAKMVWELELNCRVKNNNIKKRTSWLMVN